MPKKIVIIGGGFGGVALAKSLSNNSEFDITLFDRTNHHLFQPLLYQVASAALSPGDIAVPIREILAEGRNIKVIMDEVVAISKTEQKVRTKSEVFVDFDYLVMAVGARHSYFGKNEWENFAPGLKSLKDALDIRNKMLRTFEEAEKSESKEKINFVVIGAGPTGVEMAGALAEISKQTLINDFRNIDSSEANIYLVEGGKQILGFYPDFLAAKAQTYLEELGVKVLLNSFVTHIDKDKIQIGDKVIQTKNIVWAAGNEASPLLKQLETPLDKMGRAIVTPKLHLPENENIFVIGDACCFKENGVPLPGLAPVAAQMGKYLGKFLSGSTKDSFKYFDKGSMATIGKFKAILKLGRLTMGGFPAWLAWCFVHILFLIDFRNKLIVFTQWALSFFLNKRGVRIIANSSNE